MSSLRNASKAGARTYRERKQPGNRAHLGLLEKKKDYKLRADDYQRKQNTLKALKRKAQDRNPDEFYHNMVHTQKVEGVHQQKESDVAECSEDQLKLMYSQDLRYITMKRTSELRKIERLKASLHLLDASEEHQNKHIIYVDTKKEAKQFDAAKHFDTHPALLGRKYNRPTMETLQKGALIGCVDEEELAKHAKEREKKYKELTRRIKREKELDILSQKMQMTKNLMDKKLKRKKVKAETKESAAQYRWCFKRKR
ncbi:hypothetical protein ScPMuIL_011906 [Solemya velum]